MILVDMFQVCGEKNRFEKLMEFFCKEDKNIDFMVYLFKHLQKAVYLINVTVELGLRWYIYIFDWIYTIKFVRLQEEQILLCNGSS